MPQAYLPLTDPHPAERAQSLTTQRECYKYSLNRVKGVSLLESVPDVESFSVDYYKGRLVAAARILANAVKVSIEDFMLPSDLTPRFRKLFRKLPIPISRSNWESDRWFAEMRLSGPNPQSIFVVNEDSPLLEAGEFGEVDLSDTLDDGSTLRSLATEGRLFAVDHRRALSGVLGGAVGKANKYCPSVVALFVQKTSPVPGDRVLAPLVIKIADAPGAAYVTCTRRESAEAWRIAKCGFQVADANFHEMAVHLGRTHFALQPFGVSTHRCLSARHPLHALLKPHMKFMLFNNELGVAQLVQPRGPVDRLLAGTLAQSLEVAIAAAREWNVLEESFPQTLSRRGVDHGSKLESYAYRDDGLLIWDAVHAYVSGYLGAYYPDDGAVAKDVELQQWASELSSATGGNVTGMPASIEQLSLLTKIVSTVIFTCSAVHSAVNFPQYDHMAFVPNMPLAAYAAISPLIKLVKQTPSTPDPLANILPSFGATLRQIEVMYTLTGYQVDSLGDYGDAFEDPGAVAAHQAFMQALRVAEETINARNRLRAYPYKYLKPSQVLNSISI